MAQFHFVEDYEKHVDQLIAKHPIDEAMALAVGGSYERIGAIEFEILRHAGLKTGMSVVDMGCGSGRLAYAISRAKLRIEYTGVDIVQSLLDYAASRCPPYYKFVMHRQLSIPARDNTVDILSAFSLFTHLLHTETYLYLEGAHRALKRGGIVVFSFLEFAAPTHWGQFLLTVENSRRSTSPHLNMFIERNAIALWAEKLGYAVVGYVEPEQSVGPTGFLGQSTVLLRKA